MDFSILTISPLFIGYSTEEISMILSSVRYQVRKFNAGTMIAVSGDPVTSLMIVISGNAKGEMVDVAGRVIKIEDIPAPGALASAFLFGNRNMFPVNVIATTNTDLLIINKQEFIKLLKSEERIMVNFLNMISARSQFLSEKIRFLNFKTLKVKLAQYILQKAGKDGKTIVLDMTQNDFADFFGVTRPSVARVIHELEDDGLIVANRKKITIIKRKELSDLILD